ncbi:hypothetical protein PB2503_05047 [Parvularcula bermudensis HTCC2503]|uniref:Uncharacterized protein n=1 Tax=Parvularcula bermudensis (strain ATCC BAA-594 / HTCC2503 / KCTC 12087) TaxID=314260 RepID=E0TFR9_PARBH|nr:efflux RND transporter permease subunit [Parvularcula bermudensis]ADM09084.1 hypothetical protein PB2503_05047 [Parvularcula bermudensis HTCC2503]
MKTVLFDHPRALILVILVILVGGIASLLTMPQAEDPKVRDRIGTILTAYPGASALRLERLITEPLEQRLLEVPEIDTLNSVSSGGMSSIWFEFHDHVNDTDQVFGKIRDIIEEVTPDLPVEAGPPRLRHNHVYAYTLLAALIWEGEDAPNPLILKRTAEELRSQLRRVPGTEYTDIHGIGPEQIAVLLNADRAQAHGLSERQVAAALSQADTKIAAGRLYGDYTEFTLEVAGELDTLDRIRQVPIRQGPGGGSLRIGDVADVSRGLATPESEAVFINGHRAVIVGTRLEDGLRVGAWAKTVRQTLTAFENDLSGGVDLKVIFDQSAYTDQRFGALVSNLACGLALVVVVLFFTMGWRPALIVTAAIPLTVLASFIFLDQFGIPIHQMTVVGLIVALGLLVDAAIVMCDSVGQALDEGQPARTAVAASVERLWRPLLSSTLTTALAFLPITLLNGSAGEFVGPIADSVIIAVLASLILALTVVAALAGLFLKPSRTTNHVRKSPFSPLARGFDRLLAMSLSAPRLSLAASLIVPVLGFYGITTLPIQFFPPADRNQFHVQLQLPPQASLLATQEAAMEADRVLREIDRVQSIEWTIGNSVPAFYYNLKMNRDGAQHFAEAIVTLDRLDDMMGVINRTQRRLSEALPSVQVNAMPLMQGAPSDAPFEVRLTGPDLQTLQRLGEDVRLLLSQVPGVTVTTASLAGGVPKLWLAADEDRVQAAGLTLSQLNGDLGDKLFGVAAGAVIEGETSLPVVVRLDDTARRSMDQIRTLSISNSSSQGIGIPLSALTEFELRPSPAQITHYAGERVNTIYAFVHAGSLPGAAVSAFTEAVAEGELSFPPGYGFEMGGDAEARAKAVTSLMSSVGLIVVAAIATVVLSFNSFRLAAIVFAVAALSIGLGMFSLAMGGFPFGFVVIIALMGLVGVAINASIIILSTLQNDPPSAAGDPDAIRRAVYGTARHITSTTLTTSIGFVPLLLSTGGLWPPFSATIAGGILLSTIVSFFFVPACFLLLRRKTSEKPISLPPRPKGLIRADL